MKTEPTQTFKVVAVTPSGRAEFMNIFKRFIYRKINEGLIDQWQLWVNTIKPEDLANLAAMESENPASIEKNLDLFLTGGRSFAQHSRQFVEQPCYLFVILCLKPLI